MLWYYTLFIEFKYKEFKMKNSNNKLTHTERIVQIDQALFCAYDLQDHDVWDIYEAAQDAHLDLRQVEEMDDANMDRFMTLAHELEAIFDAVYTRVTQEQKDYFNERGLQYGIIE